MTWRSAGSRPGLGQPVLHGRDPGDGVGGCVTPWDPARPERGQPADDTRVDRPADPDGHATGLERLRHHVDRLEVELGRVVRWRAARARASGSTSSVWSSSRPRPSNDSPAASYSSRCQPTPTPRSSRPPESTSSVAVDFASTDGTAQRGDEDVGAEADARRHPRDHRQRGERLEPVTVGTGRLLAARLATDLGPCRTPRAARRTRRGRTRRGGRRPLRRPRSRRRTAVARYRDLRRRTTSRRWRAGSSRA